MLPQFPFASAALAVLLAGAAPRSALAQSPVGSGAPSAEAAPAPAAATDAPVVAPAAPARTQPLFSPVASVFTRYELRRNYSLGVPGGEGEDAVRYRTRLGTKSAELAVSDRIGLSLRVVAQAAGVWNVGGDTLEHPALALHEGVISLKAGSTRVDVGRFEMAYGEHLVVGTVDWNPVGRAFDGLRFHSAFLNKAWLDGFATWIDDGWGRADVGDTIAEGDVVFAGLYAGLGPAIAEKLELDVYVLSRITPALRTTMQSRPGTADATLGARYKHRVALVDFRVEGGGQFGGRALADGTDVRRALAWQVDAEAGLNFAADKVRVGIEGFRASGDNLETKDVDEGWAQLYPTAHRWLGHMDVIPARTDVQGAVLHVSGKPHVRHSVFADVHGFFHVQEPKEASSFRGLEVDVGAAQTLGRGLTLRQEFGAFQPSTDAQDDKLRLFAEIELRLTLPLPE
jgi:hypothetical protein